MDLMAAVKRNQSSTNTMSRTGSHQLPPLRNAPGSRRQFSRGLPTVSGNVGTNDLTSAAALENVSRAGSYATGREMNANPQKERVLFPTQVKESFLQRNAHMAN